MDPLLLAGFTLVIGLIVGLVVMRLMSASSNEQSSGGLTMLQQQIESLTRTVDAKLGESSKDMRESVQSQMSESRKLIADITREMTEVKEGNKQVFTVAEQLQSLEKVLKNQKQRGNLGEAGLELILSNVLPPTAYKLQYGFKSGEAVDAVVITKDGFIPVDAKFSLDNYNRVTDAKTDDEREVAQNEFKKDLKKRIDETAKYIRPDEGTLPFAFMYIPAEGIYYDLLVNDNNVGLGVNARSLIDYAYKDKNVIIVSPTTFSAYLQSVLYGFRAFQVEERSKEIIKNVEELGRHIASYEQYMTKLGTTLGTVVGHYNTAHKELKKVDKDVRRIAGESPGIEPLTLDKPDVE